LDLGSLIVDGQVTKGHFALGTTRREQHVVVLGKTGTGKSSFLRHLCRQDIEAGRGFVFFDIHGDASPFILSTIADQERTTGQDLSERLIFVEPADPEFSVGLNVLESDKADFVRIAEVAQVLRNRWHLDTFGARTDELLRNSLFVLAVKGHTLVELAPFLTQANFRAACLHDLPDSEVKQYFNWRYDQASEAMRRVMCEPILNKTSAFTSDPHFRHIVGQQASTFSVRQAMDEGKWVVLNLDKGQLGEQSLTLGSLFLAMIKNALFSRKRRNLFTLYCDEIQNLVAYGSGLEIIFSEARKFGISVISANQYLDQYPAEMRAAILAVGTHIFFQLSSPDAQQISTALDGGKSLSELLRNLRQRHMVVKSGHERWREVIVPTVQQPGVSYADLYNRSRAAWARTREGIDRMIGKRLDAIYRNSNEALNDWE